MSDLTTVGDADNWMCWLCDKPVDPEASINADLGPSVDSYAATRVKKGKQYVERLAHRACNTMKGKVAPVVPWSPELFVVDPSPIFEAVERLRTKGGREIVARCPDENDAKTVAPIGFSTDCRGLRPTLTSRPRSAQAEASSCWQ
jgi:hypothetical protein